MQLIPYTFRRDTFLTPPKLGLQSFLHDFIPGILQLDVFHTQVETNHRGIDVYVWLYSVCTTANHLYRMTNPLRRVMVVHGVDNVIKISTEY